MTVWHYLFWVENNKISAILKNGKKFEIRPVEIQKRGEKCLQSTINAGVNLLAGFQTN